MGRFVGHLSPPARAPFLTCKTLPVDQTDACLCFSSVESLNTLAWNLLFLNLACNTSIHYELRSATMVGATLEGTEIT